MNVRGFAQEGSAFCGQGREITALVALEDASLHEAPRLELVDRAGHAAR